MKLVENGSVEQLRAKASQIESILTREYGERLWDANNYIQDITGALIATILSQNTSDLNSGRAYALLCQAFPQGWDAVRTVSVDEVADAIRPGGLADMKAPRIQRILQEIYDRTGSTGLEQLRTWNDAAIEDFLISFPGVGPKTAACVLMFNLGRPALPVDTHVHRVALRLGLIGPKVNADKAHKLLLDLVTPEQVYSFHVHLIEHGRRTCHARRPACERCPVQSECDAYQNGLVS